MQEKIGSAPFCMGWRFSAKPKLEQSLASKKKVFRTQNIIPIYDKIWYNNFVATPILVTGRGCGNGHFYYAGRFCLSECGCVLHLQMARQKQWQLRAYIKTPGTPSRCFYLV